MVKKTGMLLAYNLFRKNGLTPAQSLTAVQCARRKPEWTIGQVPDMAERVRTLTPLQCANVQYIIRTVPAIR